jgi:NADH-quinone oxidoreductase subunit N
MLLTVVTLALRRRLTLSSGLATLGTVLVAAFSLWAPIDEPITLLGFTVKFSSSWRVLGRSFIMDESNRAAVSYLFMAGAFVFGGAWMARPASGFFFVGLASLGMVVASLLIRPFLFAAVFLELSAMGAVLLIVSPEYPAKRGGLRLLILYTLAMLAILLAGWMVESVGVTSATPDLALQATVLLALGFAVLMAVPPFHIWLPAASRESNPYAFAFVTIILQSAGLFFMLQFLDNYAWLREVALLYPGMRLIGTAMVWLGGLWTLAQRSFSKVMAYALLTDFGVMLIAVGIGSPEGIRIALSLTWVREISLIVMALGATHLLEHAREGEQEGLKGMAYLKPLAVASSLIGLLSVAGFPLTAGFPGRWAILTILGPSDLLASSSVLVASLCLVATAIRWSRIFLGITSSQDIPRLKNTERLFVGGGIIFCIVLGIFPQILYPWVNEAVAGMTQLIP